MSSSRTSSVGEYIVTAKIGSGSFAVVYKGHHKTTNIPVAIKAINRERLNSKLQENLESEISILRNTEHPNIVQLYDIKKTEKHIYLIMEYCAGGDLQRFIRKNKTLPEKVAQHFLKELAGGLAFLWSRNLIHRDLKPQNLLLTSDAPNTTLKIADFGFARHLATASMAETLCGSPLYMAPEILRFQKYDAKADLWSVGTILFEMVVGRPPFGGSNHVQLLANIERNELRFPQDISVSESYISLLQILLKRNPMNRCTFEEFFESPFVQIDVNKPLFVVQSKEEYCGPDVEHQPVRRSLSAFTELNYETNGILHEVGTTTREIPRRHSTNSSTTSTNLEYRNSAKSSRWALPGYESNANSSGSNSGILNSGNTGNINIGNTVGCPSPKTNPFKSSSGSSPPDAITSKPPLPPHNSGNIVRSGESNRSSSLRAADVEEYVLVDNVDSPQHGRKENNLTTNTLSTTPKTQQPTSSTTSNPISITDTITYVEMVGRRAQAIAQLGDRVALEAVTQSSPGSSIELSGLLGEGMDNVLSTSGSSRSRYSDALTIYLKSLELFHVAIQATRTALDSLNRRRGGPMDTDQPQCFVLALSWLGDQLNRCLERAEECKKRVPTDSSPSPSSQELLYSHAMQLGRDGAVKEVLGQKTKGQDLYLQAQLLLETLLMDPSIGDMDRNLLMSFIKGFASRIESNVVEP